MAGGFGEADVAGDDGVEEQVAEVLFELFADFDDEAAAAVVHGADDAGYVEVGDAFEGVVFAKHGDDDTIGGGLASRSPHPIACEPSAHTTPYL